MVLDQFAIIGDSTVQGIKKYLKQFKTLRLKVKLSVKKMVTIFNKLEQNNVCLKFLFIVSNYF